VTELTPCWTGGGGGDCLLTHTQCDLETIPIMLQCKLRLRVAFTPDQDGLGEIGTKAVVTWGVGDRYLTHTACDLETIPTMVQCKPKLRAAFIPTHRTAWVRSGPRSVVNDL